jgi:hypothetical protein
MDVGRSHEIVTLILAMNRYTEKKPSGSENDMTLPTEVVDRSCAEASYTSHHLKEESEEVSGTLFV